MCNTCKNDYNLNGTLCVPVKITCSENCLTCSSTSKCTTCNPTFALLTNGSCTPCASECVSTCGPNDPLLCTECKVGFYKASGKCVKCPLNCKSCSNNGICDTCNSGF